MTALFIAVILCAQLIPGTWQVFVKYWNKLVNLFISLSFHGWMWINSNRSDSDVLKFSIRTSLVVQWQRIRLPKQGTWVRSLQGTKIPHVGGQLSPHATTTELESLKERAHVPQTTEPTRSGARAPQLERENPHAATRGKPARCNKDPVCHN